MKFIALSASHTSASLSLFHDELPVMTVEAGRLVQPSFWFVDAVEMITSHTGTGTGNLDFLAVDVGPGSFTGIKVAISFAQGIAIGGKLPLVAVNSLEMDTALLPEGATGLFTRNANRGLCYYAVYRKEHSGVVPLITPSAAAAADIAAQLSGLQCSELWCTGERIELSGKNIVYVNDMTPGSKKMGEISLARYTCGQVLSSDTIKPLYVRQPDAKISSQR